MAEPTDATTPPAAPSSAPATTAPAAPTAPTPAVPSAAGRADNPFRAIALLIGSVRTSLEGIKTPGQAPRWVRIVRVREFQDPDTGEADPVAKGVMAAMGGFGQAIAYIQRFTLIARDLLTQGDAAKALVEVSAEFIKTATSKEFINSLEVAVGQEPSPSSPLEAVGGVVDTIVKIADKVPTPEDLDVIGRELYLLLCVVQIEGGVVEVKTEAHIDIGKTGKLRLVQWGFAQNLPLFNLGKEDKVEIGRLGARRVWQAAAAQLPTKSTGKWGEAPALEEVFDLGFTADKDGSDLFEANGVLEALGYTEPPVSDKKVFDADLARRLRRFQVINGLKVTGKLDNATINRLLHLDFDSKVLKRAKRFRADDLPVGFDDTKSDTTAGSTTDTPADTTKK